MKRLSASPRPDWEQTVESQGFLFHTGDEGQPYWDESAYYQFTRAEIDQIEQATYALDEMCLQAVEYVISQGRFERFQVPPPFVDYVRQSWERDEITVYGRFDFAFDGRGEPKLLEYNADTPTSLLEASVIQWHWFKATHPELDQFNAIHERLIEAWGAAAAEPGRPEGPWYFTAMNGVLEDYMTVTYLRDTAMQAGLATEYVDVERIGWNWGRRLFVDEAERHMGNVFKLYPWEWLIREQFAPQLLEARDSTRWMEAPWKMLLSNKAILPVLWELFPDSPYLLQANYDPLDRPYVRKPMLGREGANVRKVIGGQVTLETEGPYGGGPWVYQALHPIADFAGNYPVVGSWMINGYACGIGVREDTQPITQNTSRFVPHLMEGAT
jgi:glutathionylspermidine synthase